MRNINMTCRTQRSNIHILITLNQIVNLDRQCKNKRTTGRIQLAVGALGRTASSNVNMSTASYFKRKLKCI